MYQERFITTSHVSCDLKAEYTQILWTECLSRTYKKTCWLQSNHHALNQYARCLCLN